MKKFWKLLVGLALISAMALRTVRKTQETASGLAVRKTIINSNNNRITAPAQ